MYRVNPTLQGAKVHLRNRVRVKRKLAFTILVHLYAYAHQSFIFFWGLG